MLKIVIVVALVLWFAYRMLPRLGTLLGRRARKPFRQARWMWSWVAGGEAESLKAEREYGEECARQFAAQFPGRVQPDLQHLAASVGAALAKAVNDPRRTFSVVVVAATNTNAYALPGGFVFLTEPLLNLCGCDRDEIAFFIGHEFGHLLRGHAREQLTTSVFLSAVTGRLPGAGPMLREVLNKGYSRELELDADREAVGLVRVAGFDPGASIRALRRLASMSPEPALGEYFSTHPPFADRIHQLEKIVAI